MGFTYNGDLTATATIASITGQSFGYVGNLTATSTIESTGTFTYSYIGNLTASATPTSDVKFNIGFPYVNKAIVIIDGRDYSSRLHDRINVTRQDNAAATFNITIFSQIKPVEFVNKIITITFESGTAQGTSKNVIDVFKGQIKRIDYNHDSKIFRLSGYDYGGVHGEPGQYVSTDITPVLTGAVYIDSPATYNLAQNPIWAVEQVIPTDQIEDGRDYFVNPLEGKIEVPETSNFSEIPGSLTYSYATYFDDMLALLQAIADEKGWTIDDTAVTLLDYTAINKQPVLSLSDESIIDVLRKFLQLSGLKMETNLFPTLRLYSDLDNFVTRDQHLLNEKNIYEKTLRYNIDFSEVINQQEIRSAGKQFSNIVVGSSEAIKTDSGQTVPLLQGFFPFTVVPGDNQDTKGKAYSLALEMYNSLVGQGKFTIVRFETGVKGENFQSLSIVPSGDLYTTFNFNQFIIRSIVSADWVQSFDEGNILYELKVDPILRETGATWQVFYPGALNWGLTVNGSKIEYGEGTIEDVVVVTANRSINGVTETLKGDSIEHAYLETGAQGGAFGNAILNTKGNFYNMSSQIPLHEVAGFQIGNRVKVEQEKTSQFIGNIKQLSYNIDYSSGGAFAGVEAQGIGNTI